MKRYVWIFGGESRPIGLWVAPSLLKDRNRDTVLKTAVSMEKAQLEKAGHDAERAGFGLGLFMAIGERQYRTVPIQRVVLANNVTFEGGAFLMLWKHQAPSEATDPAAAWEVRNNGGQPSILPRQARARESEAGSGKKPWWQFWR